jgi:hypothetical protein
MAPQNTAADLQPLIDRQQLVIQMLRARIAEFEALTTVITTFDGQAPLVPHSEGNDAASTRELAGVA